MEPFRTRWKQWAAQEEGRCPHLKGSGSPYGFLACSTSPFRQPTAVVQCSAISLATPFPSSLYKCFIAYLRHKASCQPEYHIETSVKIRAEVWTYFWAPAGQASPSTGIRISNQNKVLPTRNYGRQSYLLKGAVSLMPIDYCSGAPIPSHFKKHACRIPKMELLYSPPGLFG